MTTTPRDSGPHAVVWAWWVICGLVVLQVASSPLVVAVVLMVSAFVVEAAGHDSALRRAIPVLVGLATVFALLRVVLVAATTHTAGDALVTLPSFTLPELLGGFEVGGAISTAVVARVAAESFVVVGIVGVVASFNGVVSHAALLRAAPRAFHELGLVVTVALAFVPSVLAAIRDTREADRARTGGRVVRRGRLRRLIVPVVDGALDRAVRLAASMDARGLGHGGPTTADRTGAGLAMLGIGLVLAAFVLAVRTLETWATVVGLVGALAVITGTVVASRGSARTRYRPQPLSRSDLLIMGLTALAPVGVLLAAAAGREVGYDPAASLMPSIDPAVAVASVMLAVPGMAVLGRRPEKVTA